ncbi:MAG: 6-phospho-beta-glucosidase [Clostridium saudiense]|uniref:6-phospho-beta-glucosidase n=1 Tax=Clostridium saudiense TaxID=1414720 RepID=UPI002910410B|nr:6-phospho-beta-glucosidase [Clostridium saudiense]MDU3520794.1 6-phospho-beta-glucosidase [Clostridium saudiense]
MKNGIKIVTIGGGSSYTPELVEGFIKRHKELPVKELWLVDIEEGKHKLEIVGNLAKRMIKKAGVDMEVNLTLDRREALKDADFVTTQLRVGLLDARIKDERIPLSHGVIGQETNGAGGLFKALRTVPVVLDIIKDIEELCPNAWLVNFTNPTGVISEAVFKYTNFRRYIGLCNVPIGVKNGMADILEVEKDRVEMDFAGLNHMVYALNVRLDGKDITKEAIEKFVTSSLTMQNIKDIPLNADFVRALGVIPCPYHKYYYKHKEMLEEELEGFKDGKTRGETVKALEDDLFELYKDENLAVKPPQLEKRGGAYYSDAACNLINSIYNDKKDIQVVNTLNNGAIRDFREDSAAEMSCVITKEGPKPLSVGYLPVAVSGLVTEIKAFEILAAKAAVEGDYNAALQALCINPLIPSDDLAKTILDEMMEAHKEYLPQFK